MAENVNVTVAYALKKGKTMVIIPSILLGSCILLLVAPLLSLLGLHPFFAIVAAAFACTAAGLTYYCFATTRWRIWAFARVANVHELKRAAITAQIINPDNSWLERLEIRSTADKQKLAELQSRFSLPDVFTDDPAVPWELSIYASSYTFYNIGISLIIFGLLFLLISSLWASLIIVSGVAIVFATRYASKHSSNKKALITLNNKGVTTIPTGYVPWEDVKNEAVIFQRNQSPILPSSGSRSEYYVFRFDHPNGSETINISHMDIKPTHLDHLLYVFRSRWQHGVN